MPLAREHHARVLVRDGDGDVRERLVVAQPHVVRRPVALDEVLLEMQRLGLGAGHDHLDPPHALDHPLDARARVAAVEVRAHAGAQPLGLADVQHLVAVAVKEVDTGALGQRAQLLPEWIRHHG